MSVRYGRYGSYRQDGLPRPPANAAKPPSPILPGDKRLEEWECAQRSGIGLDPEQAGLVLAYVRTLEAGLRQKATREETR